MWRMLSFKNVKKNQTFWECWTGQKTGKTVKNLANGQKILTMLRKAKVFWEFVIWLVISKGLSST